jgi:RimJ/RimL family protein N-acetyltransferase
LVTKVAIENARPFSALQMLREGLSGSKTRVRLWTPGDAEKLFQAIDSSREHLRPWMEWVDRHQSPHDTAEYIARSTIEFTRREQIGLGIFDVADNRTVLGATGFHDIDWTVPALEIGYWIVKSAQGRGYVGEAVKLLTTFALDNLEANRIGIHCDPGNFRSRMVAERAGYKLEGQFRNKARAASGSLRDTLVYSFIPGDRE